MEDTRETEAVRSLGNLLLAWLRNAGFVDLRSLSLSTKGRDGKALFNILTRAIGFDFGIAGTATAFPAFQKQFGIPFPSQPSGYLVPARYQSGWSGASTAGDFLGVIVAGQLLDLIGRKHIILAGCIVTAAGVGMQVGSSEWKLFLAGRLINGEFRPQAMKP